MQPYTFEGGVAVVTGAAGGIGRALALDLAARGSHLALIDRDEGGLTGISTELRAAHPQLRITAHPFDLSRTADIPGLAEDVLREHRRVSLLVDNAGVALGGTFEQLSLEEFDWLMDINFRAVVALTKALLPTLRSSVGSHVVNVSSVFGIIAPVGQVAYASSKFAVRGFSEALRHELAPLGVGVTVVHPGGVRTGIARNARVGANVPRSDNERSLGHMDRLLRMDPRQAAGIVLLGVQRRAPRVVVGSDAKVLDVLARLLPGTYWKAMSLLLAPRLKPGKASRKGVRP